MKIKTEQLKEMVSKAVQGAGNNKLIPLTQFIGIVADSGELKLITTDGTNYLYVVGEVDSKDAISVTPYVEQFAKLVSKMTSEYIELNVTDGGLEVKGNGKYMLDLEPDETNEDGGFIVYPDPYNNYIETNKVKYAKTTIAMTDIKVMLDSLKSSLATSAEYPERMDYYVSDKVVAADGKQVASYAKPLFDGKVLLSPNLVELLGLMTDDIQYYITDDVMLFKTDNCYVYSRQGNDVEEYPIFNIDKLIDQKFTSTCKVTKGAFIALLERIALFVGKHDNKAIKLSFSKEGISVANKSSNSNEVIEYVSSKKHNDYECFINIDMLLDQLKAYQGDTVEIQYNNPVCIKFTGDDITQILALMVQ